MARATHSYGTRPSAAQATYVATTTWAPLWEARITPMPSTARMRAKSWLKAIVPPVSWGTATAATLLAAQTRVTLRVAVMPQASSLPETAPSTAPPTPVLSRQPPQMALLPALRSARAALSRAATMRVPSRPPNHPPSQPRSVQATTASMPRSPPRPPARLHPSLGAERAPTPTAVRRVSRPRRSRAGARPTS